MKVIINARPLGVVGFAAFLVSIALSGVASGCSKSSSPVVAQQTPIGEDGGVEIQHASITATVNSTKFVTREHFLAGGEMQISGEPLAESMGRTLADYSRDHLPTDIYFDDSPNASGPWIDLPGFSTAVESYEYSKQPMNNAALESGAGTSLIYGPLVNKTSLTGTAATANLATTLQHFAVGANTLDRFVYPAGTYPSNSPRGGNTNPLGIGKPADNPLGWPGIWPTLHVFRSFDPTIAPSGNLDLGCSISSDDNPGSGRALDCADYECDYNSLHLSNRATQIESVISPGSDGFSGWKYGLWVLNYLQVMHDSSEGPVTTVAASDLPNVGSPGNLIVGTDDSGNPTLAGTYLGSSDIEGFQAQMFITEMDNRAQDWLMNLSTTDGATLSGFANLNAALAYDYSTPPRWFPTAISVSESTADGSGFPQPSYKIMTADSDLLDQIGLLMGFSEFYALTDTGNADVGGAQTALVYFDGDPFPADDQKADGESTLHDRALGILRVAFINLDRMHSDPTSGYLVDSVTMNGSAPTRGTTITTTYAAYSILGIRTALRSLSSQLELYSNNTTDTAVGTTPLDVMTTTAPAGATFSGRMSAVLQSQAELLIDHLTDATGKAYDGWDVSANAPIDTQDLLDSHTAAVRGLFAAYLATGDVRYHDRALAVYNRMESVFYDSGARIYSVTPAPATTVEFTPLRFALLQSTLRDVYELVATKPGGEALEPILEERVARLNKLVLNGWDDRNQNRLVDWPTECVNVQPTSTGDKIARGGLQMAERTLTGETGTISDQFAAGQASGTSDREKDCVPEVDDALLPAALADSVTFTITRQ